MGIRNGLLYITISIIILALSAIGYAEEIKLSTIIPSSGTIRAPNGIVGSNYIAATVPDNTLMVDNLTATNLNVTGTVSLPPSDIRFKKSIEVLPNGMLSKLSTLRGVSFEWKKDEFKDMNFPAGRHIGMIAQEVEKEYPELVNTGAKGYKAIEYDKFTAVLLEGIKELKAENEALAKRVEALEKRLK